jgi:hypothetical protein
MSLLNHTMLWDYRVAPDAMNGLFPGTYYELAASYVDDLIGATHESALFAQEFIRRSGAKNTSSLAMYLGLDLEQKHDRGLDCHQFQNMSREGCRTYQRSSGR